MAQQPASDQTRTPNFVVIFLDDSGWADFRPFGDPPYPTPNVQRLAAEGRRYDNFYVPQGVCSASRAALLTGCDPGRTQVFGAHAPRRKGLDPRFPTAAEVLGQAGYACAVFGKWHLGDHPDTRPPARGFHESSGLMYSNDMWHRHPERPEFWGRHPLQYWKNGRVTVEPVDDEHQNMLTTWATDDAVDFIRRRHDAPFFLYVPHSMPHVPLYCSDRFRGKSDAGLYGDVMMEIDWSVGRIMDALRETGVDERTFVVFTSDNGPWTSYGNHAGMTPFREAKGTGFDGGIRSACVIKYPPAIKPGTTSRRAFASIDLMPTMLRLAGVDATGLTIDGRDVFPLIAGDPDAKKPHRYYAFSTSSVFEGVISGNGRWKLHLPHSYRTLERAGNDGAAGKYVRGHIGLALFDLKNDPFETVDVSAANPGVLRRLKRLAENHRRRFYAD